MNSESMVFKEYTRYEKPVTVLFVIPYTLAVSYPIYGHRYFEEWKIFLLGTLTTFLFLGVMYQSFTRVALRLRKNYPTLKDTWPRILRMFAFFIPVTAVLIQGLYWVISRFHYLGSEWSLHNAAWLMLVCVLSNLLATAVNEGLYTMEKWRETIIESEELKKSNLQTRLESLKNQVNPHFLFNSLNSLSSLINEDPDMAEKFLDEMTKVYRYLLRNNEQELTNLTTELKFIGSYFHLLKTRYGDGIILGLNIDRSYEEHLIPPLTLQLLIENAVKHNVILKDQPLHINIETNDHDQIVVRNNIQLKTVHVNSNKVGLQNIAAKYKLMNQPDIDVLQTDNDFTVMIPLIKPETISVNQHEAV